MDNRKDLVRFGALYAVLFGVIAVVYPFLPIYLELRGFSPSRIGLILGAMGVSGVAAPFLVSGVADRFGRYRGMMALLVVLTLAALAVLDRSSAFPVVLAAAVAYGLVMKPLIPLTDALAGRTLKDSSNNYGRVRVWGTVSFIVVSLVLQATSLMESGGSGRLFSVIFLSFTVLLAAVPVAPGVAESGIGGGSKTKAAMPPGFGVLLLIGFLGNIGFASYQAFGSLHFAQIVGVSRVSGLFAVAAAGEIPVMIFGGRILRRLGHRNMLAAAMATGILRMVVLAAFPSPIPILLSQLTHAFTYGFFLIAGVDWVNRAVPDGRRALGMGVFTAVTFEATQLVAGSLGGFLAERAGFPALFAAAAVFPLGALGLLFKFGPAIRLDGEGLFR